MASVGCRSITNAVACEIERLLIEAFGRISHGGTLLNKHPGQTRRKSSDGVDKIELKKSAIFIPRSPDMPFKKSGRPITDWKKADMAKDWFSEDCTIEVLYDSPPTKWAKAKEKFSFHQTGMTVAN